MAAVLPAGFAAAPASACAIIAPVCLGSDAECHPTPAQRRAEQRHWSAEETRTRLAEARTRLGRGPVDFAAELAELLVPNIRPVWTQFTDCGPEGEIDYGEGRETPDSVFRALTGGTPLAGEDWGAYASVLRRQELFSFGTTCNAEFRQGFAALLRQSIAPADLRKAWLFLTARQRTQGNIASLYHRLVRFEGRARTPPVRWTLADPWLSEQVAVALRRTSWGPAISAAARDFWARRGIDLSDDAQACPAAAVQWASARQRLVAIMLDLQEARRRRRSGGQ